MYSETGVIIGTGGEVDSTIPNLIYLVDLESPNYEMTTIEAVTNGINKGVRIGDIAIHPFTGLGYGVDYFNKNLVTIDPLTGYIDNAIFPALDLPNQNFDALMFTPFGELVAHQRGAEGEYLVYFNLETGLMSNVLWIDSPPSAISYLDGCSCPYIVKLEKEITPDRTLTCSFIQSTTRIAYNIDEVQGGLVYKDSFPDGVTVEEIIYNPYGGTVNGIGTSILTLSDITPVFQIDSIVLKLKVPEEISTGTYFSQSSLSGLDLIAANDGRTTIYSDSPGTQEIGDPTSFNVLNISEVDDLETFEICAGESLILKPIADEFIDGLTFKWFDGSINNTIKIDNEGLYELTITDACRTYELSILVESVAILVDLGEDIEVLPNEGLALNPIVHSASDLIKLEWIVSDTSLISCLDCLEQMFYPVQDVEIVGLYATNETGCIDYDELIVKVDRSVYMPNVFSPNFDGNNDYVYPQTAIPIQIKKFEIYNRWGDLVHLTEGGNTNDFNEGWGGFYKGAESDVGVYLWIVELDYGQEVII